MLLRDRFLGGVSSFALMAPDGPAGGAEPDEVTVTLDRPIDQPGGQADEPDDGLSPEERQQFEEMRADEAARPPAEGDQPEPEPEVKPEPKPDVDEDEADGDDKADDKGDGKDAKGDGDKTRGRVRRTKYERDIGERDQQIKTLQDQIRERDVHMAKLDERMAIINEALTPKQQAEQRAAEEDDPAPDPEQDIFAYAKWQGRQIERLNKSIGELAGGVQQTQQQSQLERAYAQDSMQFAQSNPDFGQAYQYLLASRTVELAQYYFGKDLTEGAQLTQQEMARIQQAVEAEEQELVESSLQQRVSPAQRLYSLARARGYRKAEPADGGMQNGAAKTNGEKAPGNLAEAANGGAKPSVSEEIRRVKEGVEGSTSLSQGGAAPSMTISLKKLAEMPQDEFEAWADSLGGEDAENRVMRQIMGG